MSAEDRLDEAIDEVEDTIQNFNLAANPTNRWRAGPYSPSVEGSGHSNPLWGLHFETDRPLRLGQTLIEAAEPGTIMVRAFEYDGDTVGPHVDQRVFEATGQPEQCVDLDMYVPPGEYLLARPVPSNRNGARSQYGDAVDDQHGAAFNTTDDAIALNRVADYDGYDDDSINGVEFYGSANPFFGSNSAWYYFYNLEVSTLNE